MLVITPSRDQICFYESILHFLLQFMGYVRSCGVEVALINHVWRIWVALSMYDVYN